MSLLEVGINSHCLKMSDFIFQIVDTLKFSGFSLNAIYLISNLTFSHFLDKTNIITCALCSSVYSCEYTLIKKEVEKKFYDNVLQSLSVHVLRFRDGESARMHTKTYVNIKLILRMPCNFILFSCSLLCVVPLKIFRKLI